MIPRISRKFRANLSISAGTAYTVPSYEVTSNRTFILTDVIFSTNDPGEGVTIYDSASQATPTAAQTKMILYGNPHSITNIQNGPEFEVAVGGALIGNRALMTYALAVGGYER